MASLFWVYKNILNLRLSGILQKTLTVQFCHCLTHGSFTLLLLIPAQQYIQERPHSEDSPPLLLRQPDSGDSRQDPDGGSVTTRGQGPRRLHCSPPGSHTGEHATGQLPTGQQCWCHGIGQRETLGRALGNWWVCIIF